MRFSATRWIVAAALVALALPGAEPTSRAAVRLKIPPYDRSDYMPSGWPDVDGDCQNTRHEMLIAESLIPVKLSSDGCRVIGGLWQDPYSGEMIDNPRAMHVDHVVPLKVAHERGAAFWPPEKRRAFAEGRLCPLELLLVSARQNLSKGARTPDQWLPENPGFTPAYHHLWGRNGDCGNLSTQARAER